MYSTGIAYLLWVCSGFGVLGFHRFYLGKPGTGLLWMFTGGLGTVGAFYDLFTLPRQVREANIREAVYEETVRQKVEEREANKSWRKINDGKSRIIHGEKENVERVILKLAKENRGILTASELALSADISIEDAKKDLDAMVSKGFAELRVRQSGSLVYAIPDLLDSSEPLVR